MFRSRAFLVSPSRASYVGAFAATIALGVTGLVAPAAHAATVESDRAQIAQIQKQIAQKGAEIETLVRNANAARANLDTLHAQIRRDERLLAVDSRAQRDAQALVRKAAVVAYVGRGNGDASLAIFEGTSSITQRMSGRHYLDAVNSHWDTSIAQLELAKGRADDDRRVLLSRQDAAQHVLDQLTRAQTDANSAITAQNATLAHVSAHLESMLITQQKQKQAQARRAAHRAIAAALAAATQKEDAAPSDAPQGPVSNPTPPTQPTPPTKTLPPPKPVSGGGYANPFRSTGGLSPERIDSGVDYAGAGPVYAIGNGVVLNVYAADWPGGTFIAYQLDDGPAKGLVVYVAEDINPAVSVGSTVTANTVLGQMYGGPHGIETGWANGARIPDAMARSYGQYHGGNSTAFGYNFSRFMQALGAPGGILSNNPTGSVPAGWPTW